jgi:transposase
MIPAHVRIFVCTEPVDLRRSFDGLALAARERLGRDPLDGGLFVFANRRANRLKVLWFERTGYCLLYKRAHRALFVMPRQGDTVAVCIDRGEFARSPKAIGYARNQREALRRFLDDGRLPLHNNASELQLRREVIGRRNWLFVGSDDAAEVNTVFVSLLASCGLHRIEDQDAQERRTALGRGSPPG